MNQAHHTPADITDLPIGERLPGVYTLASRRTPAPREVCVVLLDAATGEAVLEAPDADAPSGYTSHRIDADRTRALFRCIDTLVENA